MAKPLRLAFPGALSHVTTRGKCRESIYQANQAALPIADFASHANSRQDAVTQAYDIGQYNSGRSRIILVCPYKN